MKRITVWLLVLTILVLLVLPSAAVTLQDPKIAAAREAVSASVGVDTPGAAIVLVEKGSLLMMEGIGYADISSRQLITPETVFEIGKISGLFTALTAHVLAEQGVLSLTADIAEYLPEEFVKKLNFSYPVTVEQLLLGSAGLEGRSFDLMFSKDAHRFDSLREALLAQIPRQIAAPGSFYADSPFGIALVAYVIECVTEMSYEACAAEVLLTPLGMKNTVLNPTAATLPDDRAVGHLAIDDGRFFAMANEGRSYGALYPANGGASTAEDLSILLRFLTSDAYGEVLSPASRAALLQSRYINGIFTVSAPAMQVRGGAFGVTSQNMGSAASLWMDGSGNGALVLTNVAECALTALPARLCEALSGVTVTAGGELPELDRFEGYYADVNGESSSFVGRFSRLRSNREAVAAEDGTLAFLGMRLIQIAPGAFADADGDRQVAVVQFLTNADGEVEKIVTAEGGTYLPVDFFEKKIPATILLALLVILSVYFIGTGLFSLLHYIARCYEGDGHGLIFMLPSLFAGMIGLCTFLQMLVGMKYGGAAFASFFYAMSVITMIFCIGALIVYLVAFMASLTRPGKTARVARSAILFLVLVFMTRYWGLLVL